jgi:hypothetical protein
VAGETIARSHDLVVEDGDVTARESDDALQVEQGPRHRGLLGAWPIRGGTEGEGIPILGGRRGHGQREPGLRRGRREGHPARAGGVVDDLPRFWGELEGGDAEAGQDLGIDGSGPLPWKRRRLGRTLRHLDGHGFESAPVALDTARQLDQILERPLHGQSVP